MVDRGAEPSAVDVGAYCREVEASLCRRNGGHLIRLVGPAFQLVAQWATDGVPLRIVAHGIDRAASRREARGPQRRPLRIEFCEADVLEAFDQWRRAVGPSSQGGAAAAARRSPSLPAHLDRIVLRLSSLRAGTAVPPGVAVAIDEALQRIADLGARGRGARGEARQAIRDDLATVDDALMGAVVAALDADTIDRLARRGHEELRPMRDRLDGDVYRDAHARLVRQLARADLGLPDIALP